MHNVWLAYALQWPIKQITRVVLTEWNKLQDIRQKATNAEYAFRSGARTYQQTQFI